MGGWRNQEGTKMNVRTAWVYELRDATGEPLGAGDCRECGIPFSGARRDDLVVINVTPKVPGVLVTAYVTRDDIVSVRLWNTSGEPMDFPSLTAEILVGEPKPAEAPAQPAHAPSPRRQMETQMDRKRENLVRLAEAALRGGMVRTAHEPGMKGQEAAAIAIAALREIEGVLK